MTKTDKLIFIPLAIAFIGLFALVGCVTSKVTSVDPKTGQTNTVTVVNEANLALDCEAITLGAAGTVTVVLKQSKNDPGVVKALTDAHIALDGVLHGGNTNTTQQIMGLLQSSNNPYLSKAALSFIGTLSTLEQKWLQGASATVTGEVTTRFAQAVDDGLELGLGVAQN
jgi:hypothetical protein